MLIAIASDGENVSGHFGRCEKYVLYEVESGRLANRRELPLPGHQPGGLPRSLSGHGVNVVIAGGMGPRAQALFAEEGIRTVLGASGPVEDVARAFAEGALQPGDSTCEHPSGPGHGPGHGSGHGPGHGPGRGHGRGSGWGCGGGRR